jgi:hypothetical protein
VASDIVRSIVNAAPVMKMKPVVENENVVAIRVTKVDVVVVRDVL